MSDATVPMDSLIMRKKTNATSKEKYFLKYFIYHVKSYFQNYYTAKTLYSMFDLGFTTVFMVRHTSYPAPPL